MKKHIQEKKMQILTLPYDIFQNVFKKNFQNSSDLKVTKRGKHKLICAQSLVNII